MKQENKSMFFLKNELFIKWQLSQSDELTRYWQNFLQENPDEKENFKRAIAQFKTIQLSSFKMSDSQKLALRERLNPVFEASTKKRRINFYHYAAVASIIIFVASALFFMIQKNTQKSNVNFSEFIVGNALEAEDVQLLSGSKTASFQQSIDLEISDDGKAKVTTEDNSKQNINIDKRSLNKLIVPYGKRTTLTLADGTKVWLNSGSILEFPTTFSGKSRDVFLTQGEAYLEVKSDKKHPFYLHTSNFNVRVYGTKFNVSDYRSNIASIVLVEGSVGLSNSENSKELMMKPNQIATFTEDDKVFVTKNVDATNFISWIKGYLIFDNTPISEVLDHIERYYNVSFDFGNSIELPNATCSGKIVLSESLENVMTTIALLSSVDFKIKDNKIYFRNKPK